MTIYRIYTENLKQNKLEKAVLRYFDRATFFKGQGISKQWGREKSLLIEIISEQLFNNAEPLNRLCKDIKIINNQEAVYVLEIGSSGTRSYLI